MFFVLQTREFIVGIKAGLSCMNKPDGRQQKFISFYYIATYILRFINLGFIAGPGKGVIVKIEYFCYCQQFARKFMGVQLHWNASVFIAYNVGLMLLVCLL